MFEAIWRGLTWLFTPSPLCTRCKHKLNNHRRGVCNIKDCDCLWGTDHKSRS